MQKAIFSSNENEKQQNINKLLTFTCNHINKILGSFETKDHGEQGSEKQLRNLKPYKNRKKVRVSIKYIYYN
jgi:hypothetical protein